MMQDARTRWGRIQDKAHVCVEGLALPWLAGLRGLRTLSDDPAVPSLAPVLPTRRPDAELWREPMRW